MKADQAKTGDVLLDPHGKTWLRTGENVWNWADFSGPVGYYGDWQPEYGPMGDLVLLVRDGRPVPMTAEPGAFKPVSADTVAQAEEQ